MIGKKFGMLTILKDTNLRANDKGKIYLCKCDCGTIKNVTWKLLRNSSKRRSCGCSKKDNYKKIFESNFDKNEGCWIWKGNINRGGYGKIGTKTIAHRRAYEYYKGEIPNGKCVCHVCDVPLCVNPSHLFLGTRKDNSQDAVKKGRNAKGSKIASSLLNEEKVLEMRKMRLSGKEYQEIANHFGVSWGTVGAICKNRQWKHVPLGEESKKFPQIRKVTKGIERPNAKLTEKDVLEIRKLFISGINGKEISKLFDIHYTVIMKIKNRKIWKHIDPINRDESCISQTEKE